MGRDIEVQSQALTSLSREYKVYGSSVYSRYKTGASRIERELEVILRKYAEYSSVTSKARSMQSKLYEVERQVKEVNERSSKLSQGLTQVVASYKEDERQSKQIIDSQRLNINKLSTKSTNARVNIKLNSDLTTSEVAK